MDLTPIQITSFQNKILTWYTVNKRDLPWRRTHDPYKILLSEIMSQQTQISRVIPKYQKWLKELPTLQSLANAPLSQVLKLWSGLGYNRRALYLQQTAKIIIQNHHNYFPETMYELKKLPGIGEYTASAILCFAFNHQIPIIDTNIRKVILTQICQKYHEENKDIEGYRTIKSSTKNDKTIQQIAQQILPLGQAYDWNQALMDYAALELKREKIPILKQSKLQGSNRWYRGQIIKLLIQHQATSEIQLFNLLQKEENFTGERYEKIINKLQKDKLIIVAENKIIKLS